MSRTIPGTYFARSTQPSGGWLASSGVSAGTTGAAGGGGAGAGAIAGAGAGTDAGAGGAGDEPHARTDRTSRPNAATLAVRGRAGRRRTARMVHQDDGNIKS